MPKTIPAAAALLVALCASAVHAQSLLDRPPNVSGAWVGNSGQLYFNFLHRFTSSSSPERKVINVPTFTMAVGLPRHTLVGAHYATNSQLAPRYPNEWELWARHAFFAQDGGAPLDVAGQVAYNLAASGVDGEVALARRQGPVRLMAAARILSDPLVAGQTRFAAAGGATLKLSRHLALAGDVATLLDRAADERMAWSAGLHIALPHTPHTLSLQAANTNAYTLQGSSRGEDAVRYGFEFTIPVTLARWFGGGGTPAPAAPARPSPPAAAPSPSGPVARAGMRNLAFTPARIEIAAGTTVEWTNSDAMAHTVTAADRSFDSGMIEPGRSWRHTFATPGSFDFACAPHPFMKGVVIVK